ncbi:MAG: DinB family protein, partial [Cyclobacteriaceae bacterium]|nr:DinB family protein [Cyclobacteriaceae bacterium]
LLKPSASGGWSIAQCLWHLNSYGEYYFPEIRKGLTKNYPFNPEFKSSWLGNYFTNTMKPGLKMKKYKAFKDHTPAPALDAHEVVAKFIQQQEELLDLLKLARHTDLNKVRIPISISRWLKLKLGDVFQFIIAHNERHLQQAKRNL